MLTVLLSLNSGFQKNEDIDMKKDYSSLNSKFSVEFIQAVSDWQRGGNSGMKMKRGVRIKELVADQLDEFKACSFPCYRKVKLNPHFVWEMGDKLQIKETISAWTSSPDVAQSFKGGPERGSVCVIFKIIPRNEEVIINLESLFSDSEFMNYIDNCKAQVRHFDAGTGRYLGSQKEIILEIDSVDINDIYAFGGYSSHIDTIIQKASGLKANRKSRRSADRKGGFNGESYKPNWIINDAKDRTIEFLIKQTKEIKERNECISRTISGYFDTSD